MMHSNLLCFRFLLRLMFMVFVLLALASGCARKPTLYPNEQFTRVGKDQAEADIRECMQLAEEHKVKPEQGEELVKDTAVGAGGGAVGGAVGGAISGNVGRGIATGAAGGAAVGLFFGLFRAAEPSATYKNFVNKCLGKKGYEVVGWE
ncbi:MAG: cell envelope biogenesis protein OmpA [Deltaproteobacteria bacterium]|nr:cell envelope biogenesis protein OmpA [Deltaproteobacteria bacterium]